MASSKNHKKLQHGKLKKLKLSGEGISKIKECDMDDLDRMIETRKKKSPWFTKNYEKGYEEFKICVLLRQAREEAHLTQEALAKKLKTKKTAISRMENHAEDIRLSTLQKVA